MESLSPDIHIAPGSTDGLVVSAYRPRIDKITFIRHPFGDLSGQFLKFTNQWTDIYYTVDTAISQRVERITTAPDILFSARDLGTHVGWTRTGTTNWVNNADLNGNPGGAGPGVINPPIEITFNTIGPFYLNFGPGLLDQNGATLVSGWGSFNSSTNLPILYPDVQTTFQSTRVQLDLTVAGSLHILSWNLAGRSYSQFLFQTATNLTDLDNTCHSHQLRRSL